MSFLQNNLVFYDMNGSPQPQVLDEDLGIWKYELVFDRISTGLFSTQQIHIFENVINSLDNSKVLTSPRSSTDQKIKFKFREITNNFFSYRVVWNTTLKDYFVETLSNKTNLNLDYKKDVDGTLTYSLEDDQYKNDVILNKGEVSPGIKKIVSEFVFDLFPITETSNVSLIDEGTSFIEDGFRKFEVVDRYVEPLTIQLGFMSETEGEFLEFLDVYLVDDNEETKICEISLFCEAESEDVRLTNLLSNFGQLLDQDDSLVFRDTDVNEDLLDNIVLNEKKKELILEYSNIINYIGSYKGLVNALKFYGYSDLRVKEWWLNTQTLQKYQYEIDRTTYKTIKNGNSTGMFVKKTGKFSLFYDIFKLTGELDVNGLPEIEKSFPFTQDEILIKLYGLKNLLKNKYLPLSTRIVDITGEGIVFDRISSATWNTILTYNEIGLGDIPAKISITPTYNLIDKIVEDTVVTTTQSLITLEDVSLSNIDMKLENIDNKKYKYDSPNKKSYAKINIKNTTFNRKLEDIGFIFGDIEDMVSLDLLETYPIYEIQYDIICNEGKGFKKRIVGNPLDLKDFDVLVDVIGTYDVIVKMYDIYNSVSVTRFPSAFIVELPEPNFGGVYTKNQKIKNIQDAGLKPIEDCPVDLFDSKYNDTTLNDLSFATLDDFRLENYLLLPKYDIYSGVPILTINRDDYYIEISNVGFNIEDIKKQSFATFTNTQDRMITPKGVTNTNSEGYVILSSQDVPKVGDILEIFKTAIPNGDLPIKDLEKRTLVFSGVLSLDNKTRLYTLTETQNSEFMIKSFKVDVPNQTTTVEIDDPDGLLGVEWVEYIFIKSSITYEVLNTKVMDGLVRVDLNVGDYDINDFNDGTLQAFWGRNNGVVSIPLNRVEDIGGGLLRLFLNDMEREMFLIDKTYELTFSNYDLINSILYANKDGLTFDDLSYVRIDELSHLEFNDYDRHGSFLCGFRIKNWRNFGRFRIGGEWFSFETCADDIDLAIQELKTSKVEGLSFYDYSIDGDDIVCVSKTYGVNNLNIIEFDNLVIEPQYTTRFAHNYQLAPVMSRESNYIQPSNNNRMLWNNLVREWVNYGETPIIEKDKSNNRLWVDGDLVGNFQRHLGYAMNSNWNFDVLNGGFDTLRVPKYTNMSFFDSSHSVIGKVDYVWTLLNDYTNEVLHITNNKRFSYFFTKKGSFSLKVKITDWNGNVTERVKEGFVLVE